MTQLLLPAPTIGTNRDNGHYRQDVFEMYLLWKSLPSLFKFPPIDKKSQTRPSSREFCEAMGIDDPVVIDMAQIKYQKDFAERFEVDENTLSLWNREIADRDPMEDLRAWAIKLSKNVLTALYNNAMRKGMALEVALWFKLVNQWNEKTVVEHNYKGVKSITYEIIEPKHEVHPDSDQEANQPEAGASS